MSFLPQKPTIVLPIYLAVGLVAISGAVSAQVRQSYYERSTETIEQIERMPPEDRAQMAAGDELTRSFEEAMDEGRYRDAINIAERQMDIRRDLLGDRHPELIPTLIGHGFACWQQSRFAEGEQSLRLAREIIAEHLGGSHPEMARCLDLLGLCRMAQGFHDEAEQIFFEALAITLDTCGENHELAIACYDDLGAVHQEQSDLARSEPFRRKALALSRQLYGVDHITTARLTHNLGKLLIRTGDYEEAEDLFREALDCRLRILGKDHPDVAATMDFLGSVLSLQGRYDEAEPLVRGALEINRETLGENHRHTAFNLARLARICVARGRLDEAIRLQREELAIYRSVYGDAHPNVYRCLRALAQTYLIAGDIDEAERCHLEARKLLSEPELRTFSSWYIDLFLGQIAMLRGDYKRAEEIYAGTTEGYEQSRVNLSSLERRANVGSSGNPYEALTFLRLVLGEYDEAWPTVERYLGRALYDYLVTIGERPLSPAEQARKDSLSLALTELERGYDILRNEADQNDDAPTINAAIETIRTRLLETQAEWGAFREQIRSRYPIDEGEVFSLERVQEALDDHTAIIGWFDFILKPGENFAWAYVIRSSGPVEWVKLRLDEAHATMETSPACQRFRESLAGTAAWPCRVFSLDRIEWLAKGLYKERFYPVEPYLTGVDNLVLITTGAMQGIPLEALIDSNGRSLGDRFIMSYTSSGTVYAWLAERGVSERTKIQRALIVGNPPALNRRESLGPGQPGLPAGGLEVHRVASLLPGSVLLSGELAAEPQLVQLAQTINEFDVIHVTTHARIDPERPERSYLALSQLDLPDALECAMHGKRVYDGRLTMNEIVREWNLDADLVTLSACQTALGKSVPGEGFVGFAHAFLRAGAQSVVVSLWEVDDEATAMLMGRFYENLTGTYTGERLSGCRGPMSKAAALGEAKLWLRAYIDESGRTPFRHPAYWSAFILVGDRG